MNPENRDGPVRVLLVEDDARDAVLLDRQLRIGGLDARVHRVEDDVSFRDAVATGAFDIVLADFSLPVFSATEALRFLRESGSDLPFIVVSGAIGEEVAVGLMRSGANDYVMKSNMARLAPAIRRELADAVERRRRRAAEDAIRRMAYEDALTGLPNRNALVERASRLLAEGRQLTLVLVGVDRLGDILRTVGHGVADEVVRALAVRLSAFAAPHGWLVCRIAPGSLVLVAEGLRSTQAELANELVRSLACRAQVGDVLVDVHTRLGLVEAGAEADIVTLLREAEIAREGARRQGVGWQIFDKAKDPWLVQRFGLIADLAEALRTGRTFLMYQPRIRLRGRGLAGAEALCRWSHPRLGLVPPDRFIPLAEDSGLIHPLTEWVLDVAARRARAWRDRGLDVPIGVNVSARTLHDLDVAELVTTATEAYGMAPGSLEIEVTESMLVEDPKRARQSLDALRALGVRVFLDDFGTGYSSLRYLKALPLHALKIDRAFIMGGLDDPGDMSIVASTIQLAHNLGLNVVAEGVETAETLARLAAMRCDEAQGYHISRPMTAEDLERGFGGEPRAWSADR